MWVRAMVDVRKGFAANKAGAARRGRRSEGWLVSAPRRPAGQGARNLAETMPRLVDASGRPAPLFLSKLDSDLEFDDSDSFTLQLNAPSYWNAHGVVVLWCPRHRQLEGVEFDSVFRAIGEVTRPARNAVHATTGQQPRALDVLLSLHAYVIGRPRTSLGSRRTRPCARARRKDTRRAQRQHAQPAPRLSKGPLRARAAEWHAAQAEEERVGRRRQEGRQGGARGVRGCGDRP